MTIITIMYDALCEALMYIVMLMLFTLYKLKYRG